MSKKFKVIVSVLIAVLLLTFGGTAVALAQDEPEADQTQTENGLLARIAEILGVPTEKLVEAFQQARQEMREEGVATGNGTLRQERRQFRECWDEEWQGCYGQGEQNQFKNRWTERRQESTEKRLAAGNRFQGSNGAGNQGNGQLRVSRAARGQQMIALAADEAVSMPVLSTDGIY